MPTYYINEASFELPERGFADRTLHRLESRAAGEETVAVEIRRLPMEVGKTLRQLVDEELARSAKSVTGFTVVERTEVDLGGSPAIVVRARLRAEDAVHLQLQAHVALGTTWITLVVRGSRAQQAACDEVFERTLDSIAWRSE